MRMVHRMGRRGFLLAAPAAAALIPHAGAQQGSTPSAAARVALNIRDFGAKGDGATKDTAAIQQAIDRCSVLGGGEVLAPAGNYLTGAIAMRSNTILRLEKDADDRRISRFCRLSRDAGAMGRQMDCRARWADLCHRRGSYWRRRPRKDRRQSGTWRQTDAANPAAAPGAHRADQLQRRTL